MPCHFLLDTQYNTGHELLAKWKNDSKNETVPQRWVLKIISAGIQKMYTTKQKKTIAESKFNGGGKEKFKRL